MLATAARLLVVLVVGLAALVALASGVGAQSEPPAATPSPGGAAAGAGEEDPCAGVALWRRPSCEVAEGIADGVGSAVGAGVSGVFDRLYAWVAGGATWLLGELMALIEGSTRPDVSAGWFAGRYRLMTSLAATLVTPLLLIATLTAVVKGDWPRLVRSYLVYLPAAGLGTAVAIPLVDAALGATDWMTGVFLDALGGDIEAFLSTVAEALTVGGAGTAAAGAPAVAPFLLLVGAATIAFAALAVWVELVLRAAGIYVAVFFLPLAFAGLVWPATRGWLARLGKALAALVLSKFVIVAVVALAAAALGDTASAGFSGVVAGAAMMLLAAFSPMVLFRLVDVAGDQGASAAVAGATQGRTSPIPTPSASRSAARTYSHIMHSRTGGAAAGGGAQTGAATAAGAGSAGAAVAAGGVAKATKAGPAAGGKAGQRLSETTAGSGGGSSAPGRPAPDSGHGGQPPDGGTAPRTPPPPRHAQRPPTQPPTTPGDGEE